MTLPYNAAKYLRFEVLLCILRFLCYTIMDILSNGGEIMKTNPILKAFRIFLTVSLILAGICLMYACYQVYSTGGDHPYSAKRVAEAFAPIAPAVYVALGLSLVSLFLPKEEQRRKIEKNYELMLRKLHEKHDVYGCGDQNLVQAIVNEQRRRKNNRVITWILLGLGFLVSLIYSTNMENMVASNSTPKVMHFALVMGACFAVPFGFGIYSAYAHKASICKELELMKLVAVPRSTPLVITKTQPKYMAYIPYVGIAVAVLLILVGYLGNGQAGVLAKAVEICKECVGIG